MNTRSRTPRTDAPRSRERMEALLRDLDGRGYRSYRALQGTWAMDAFTLHFEHVQGDPFAAPSRVRMIIEGSVAAFPPSAYASDERAIGTAAYLARSFAAAARDATRPRGTGRSGEIRMMHPGQVVLPTTAVRIDSLGGVEARCTVGLPANGRRVAGDQARHLILDDLSAVVHRSLLYSAHDPSIVELHAATNEDAAYLRSVVERRGLVAFVADGARLPRKSGVDDRPLESSDVVAFRSPASLRTTVDLPNGGALSGMAIPEGITLIVGGGFHGKSTLLRALQDGVYNHRPGDGREHVVTHQDAVKIRAEDGRAVAGVDISGFIDGLPLGLDTSSFTTPNASGSTSQAAEIVEALEAGARVLLIDEDTSATNFMIRDRRMQTLVPAEGEPITPFVDRARDLFEERGVSTILVVGGSGDYLDIADRVVRMADYLPQDVTEAARRVARELPTGRASEATAALAPGTHRILERSSIDPSRGRRARHVRVPDRRTLLLGKETVDLAAVEQLVLQGQVRAVGEALAWIGTELDPRVDTMPAILEAVERVLGERGLDALCEHRVGDLAAFRVHELASTLNRLRSLRCESL